MNLSQQQFRVLVVAATATAGRVSTDSSRLLDASQCTGSILCAMLVNAWFESQLGEWSTEGGKHANSGGDGGNAWGPWQCSLNGAGAGFTPAQLSDPSINAAIILREMYRQDERTGLLSAAMRMGSLGDFCATWTAEVERPGGSFVGGRFVRMSRQDVGLHRSRLIDEWYGPGVGAMPAWGWSAPGTLSLVS